MKFDVAIGTLHLTNKDLLLKELEALKIADDSVVTLAGASCTTVIEYSDGIYRVHIDDGAVKQLKAYNTADELIDALQIKGIIGKLV